MKDETSAEQIALHQRYPLPRPTRQTLQGQMDTCIDFGLGHVGTARIDHRSADNWISLPTPACVWARETRQFFRPGWPGYLMSPLRGWLDTQWFAHDTKA
jgi:hypothetical protein